MLLSYRWNPNGISLANIRFVIEASKVSDRAIASMGVRVCLSPHSCASVNVEYIRTLPQFVFAQLETTGKLSKYGNVSTNR